MVEELRRMTFRGPIDVLGPARHASTLALVRIHVVTMFPEYFAGPLDVSIVARGIEDGALSVELHDLREHGLGKHRQLDDTPFGGGPGMVMMIEPLAAALESLRNTHRVVFTPAGTPMTQDTLDRWAKTDEITFVCGRYEGIDQRVADHLADEEASLGDFVLAGGEVAAAAAIEGIVRLLPGVVGNPESTETESFRDRLLEEPVYTRPAEYRGWRVPEVLLSGDHGRIEEWRREQRLARTRERRPDLLEDGGSSDT
jgi:tRNA (guanine37-N1)-methyltransferase